MGHNTVSDDTNDPALIILAASKVAAEFDNKQKNDNQYITSAEDQLEDFVKWAWGVQARKIPRLNYLVEPGNKALLFYYQERHQTLIASTPPAQFGATNFATAVHPPTGTTPNVFNLLEVLIS
jgi:hypothetical protein